MTLPTAWPRQPFIGIALAAIIGVLFADNWPAGRAGLVCLVPLGFFALFFRSTLATYGVVAASFFTAHSLRQTDAPGVRLARELGKTKYAVTARGIVVSEPRVSIRGYSSFHLQLASLTREGITDPSHATLRAVWRGEVHYGDEVQLFGILQPCAPPRNPGEFDMRAYLARHDIYHELIVRYPENGQVLSRGGGNPILRAAHASRVWMQGALARGLEDAPELHGLISGMVLGAGGETPDEIEEQFQQTGTLHLFAVSGLNVAIVAELLWLLARAVRLPRKWALGLIIPALFFYAAITGLHASSVRAALMAAVLLGGFFAERKALGANSLAAAAIIILLVDTNELFSTGFQLSFAVVIAIFVLGEPLFRLFARWCAPDPFLPVSLLGKLSRLRQWLWRGVARGASISLAAWLGSLPLILPYFYLVTPVSLFANLVVVPIAFFVLALGLLSLLTTFFAPGIAMLFNYANGSLAAAILWLVGLFARAPAGHFYLEPPHWPSGARVEINVLDLEDGAAVHVRDGAQDWLVDCGAQRDYKRIVRSYLRSRGINRLDGLLLTHSDAAHIGGALPLTRVFRPREMVESAAPDRSNTRRLLTKQMEELGMGRRFYRAGEELTLGPRTRARILFPPPEFQASAADDQALVVQLTIDSRWRVLLLSDSGEATEALLLGSGAGLRSDIVIKGQHRSGRSASPEFLAAASPKLIVASSVAFPENERLKDEWAADVGARGIKLLRQDETGAVRLRFWRDRWEAAPHLRPEKSSNGPKIFR